MKESTLHLTILGVLLLLIPLLTMAIILGGIFEKSILPGLSSGIIVGMTLILSILFIGYPLYTKKNNTYTEKHNTLPLYGLSIALEGIGHVIPAPFGIMISFFGILLLVSTLICDYKKDMGVFWLYRNL